MIMDIKAPNSIEEYIKGYCGAYAENVFMRMNRNGITEEKSYRDFGNDCFRLAETMLTMNFTDKHVAMFCESRYEYIVCMFACMLSGATFMPVYVTLPEESIAKMVSFADVDIAFISDRYKPTVENIEQMGTKIPLHIYVDEQGENSYYGLISKEISGEFDFYGDINDDRAALFCFTSGTSSGKPKCVMLSYKNVLATAHHEAFKLIEVHEGSYHNHSHLPMFHLALLVALIVDYTIPKGSILSVSDNVKDCFRDIVAEKPLLIVTVPAVAKTFLELLENEVIKSGKKEEFERYCRECDEGKYTREERYELTRVYRKPLGERVECLCVVGAQSSPDMVRRISYFGIHIGCEYGLTECSPCVTTDRIIQKKKGSVGKLLPYMQAKLVDGELYVKGDHVMKGYYKNPEGTAAMITEDGWLCTGDIAELDSDGFLFIRGRASSVAVLSNGDNIDVEELEVQVASACEAIEEIIIMPDKRNNSDTLGALIYARSPFTYDDVKKQLAEFNKQLQVQKRIIRFRLVDSPFERNAMMKIKRFIYRDCEI